MSNRELSDKMVSNREIRISIPIEKRKNNALDSLVSWSMKNAMNCDKQHDLYNAKC